MMLPTFNIPPIGPTQGKVWGQTRLAFAYNGVEAHVISVKKGSFCSLHSHVHKWNRFVVLSGRLAVRVYQFEVDNADETIVGPGQITDVPPAVKHEFEALEDTAAVEFYWVTLDPNDIDRGGTQGGMRDG